MVKRYGYNYFLGGINRRGRTDRNEWRAKTFEPYFDCYMRLQQARIQLKSQDSTLARDFPRNVVPVVGNTTGRRRSKRTFTLHVTTGTVGADNKV